MAGWFSSGGMRKFFLDGILNPPGPNERLRAALEEHTSRVQSG